MNDFAGVCFIGWSIWKSKPCTSQNKATSLPPKKQIAFAASVSLLNPHAILDTIGVIGTSSLSYGGTEKWVFTITTIVVSWIWFIGLASAGRIIGDLDKTGSLMIRLNKISALLIWGVALYMGWKFIEELLRIFV